MFEEENVEKESKQKEKMQLLVVLFLAGIGYYFFIYLNNKREEAKKEVNKLFQQNSSITTADLDSNLWKDKETWEEYVDNLYLSSQINLFVRKIKKVIKEKAEIEQEKPKKARGNAKKEIEDFAKSNWTKDELKSVELQKKIREFNKKIDKTSAGELSSVINETNDFIIDIKVKRQGLHWKRKIHNWADRWLLRNRNSFESAWEKMAKMYGGIEPDYFDIAAIYEIKFPPSIWSELTEKQKELAKEKGHSELKLKDEVQDYKFSTLITDWEDKVRSNPVRGELDPNDLSNLDNNALFYGAPRTGKSIMVEKMAYEIDKYPLVVIQGSTLTPKKPDNDIGATLLIKFIYTVSDITHKLVEDFGFERDEKDGEVRYILFLDECDQICTTHLLPPKDASSQLTFLKECMGSDSKEEESKNLWIAATNHLDNVNSAVYQSGRLSNRLSFSWTIGEFMQYATDAGINAQFPQRWIDDTVLNDEDNKWVNRFNKIIFDKDFLPFWSKFIDKNPEAEYEPEEDEKKKPEECEDDNDKEDEKTKIKWGEMFEFFWRLKDSSQLDNFDGKFVNPRDPKIEEVIKESSVLAANHISKTIDRRLKDVWESIGRIEDEMTSANTAYSKIIKESVEEITTLLSTIGNKIK